MFLYSKGLGKNPGRETEESASWCIKKTAIRLMYQESPRIDLTLAAALR